MERYLIGRLPKTLVALGIVVALLTLACSPAATPTPLPTKAPASAPSTTSEPTKPAAPVPTATAAPAPKPVTLKYGGLQTASEAGIYAAMEKGYFKEQGITMELTNFRTIAELIAPLGTGQLDVTAMPLSVPLLAAADRGVEFKIVGDKAQSRPGWEYCWMLLRKDLADSGQVKTVADLKGAKVSIPSPAAQGDMTVQLMIAQGGLKPGDVEVIVLPFVESAAALGNKAISAGFTCEPFIATGLQAGFAVKWIPNSQYFDGKVETSVVIFGSTLLKDPDLARRWMIAYLKGNRDYTKAFTAKDGRQEIMDIIMKYTTVKDPKLFDIMEMPYQDPNGQLDRKSMDAQYKWYTDTGLYTGKTTLDKLMDFSYLDYAVQKLGKQ
ncbi:MAG: ABC transporter substrate-binding protein [Dehalococcoidia bacterium]|nr:ABC transporter substrate-binding protein [Dehalococcoidia bacterium]